jgi:hypothetical protein
MKELFSNIPDTATPLNSNGGYKNASGSFPIKRSLTRKTPSRDDLDQPKRELFEEEGPLATSSSPENNAVDRYFGAFSIESKRHVWDLLDKHPKFDKTGKVRLNRIENNTREVLPNDPTKIIQNGGSVTYENPENDKKSK